MGQIVITEYMEAAAIEQLSAAYPRCTTRSCTPRRTGCAPPWPMPGR